MLLVLGKLQPDRPRDRLDERGDVAGGHVLLDGRLELAQGCVGRVAVEDARVPLGRLAQRPVRDPFSVREAPALEEVRIGQPFDELRDEPGLPDPGVAVDRHQLRRAFARDARGERAEHDELLLSADHLRRQTVDPPRPGERDDRSRLPGGERRVLPLRRRGAQVHVADGAPGRSLRPLPDEHLAGLGALLEPRRDVDRVAAHHQLAPRDRLAPGHHLTRVHPDPEADVDAVPLVDATGELGEPVPHGECGAYGSLGVVVVRHRDAEHREHGVADELLADPAEALDLGVDELEQLPLDHAELLRVDTGAERGRACQVGEQRRDDTPVTALGRRGGICGRPAGTPDWCKRRATARTEAGIFVRLGPARRTAHVVRRPQEIVRSGRASAAAARTLIRAATVWAIAVSACAAGPGSRWATAGTPTSPP